MNYVILAMAWGVWCTIHSALISTGAMHRLRRALGDRFRFVRVAYNGIAVATLLPVLWYERSIAATMLWSWPGSWVVVQVMMIVCALVLFAAGGRHYDGQSFLGVRQIHEGAQSRTLSATGHLNTDGVLGVTRHPWYLATMVMIWARPVDTAALVTNLALSVYLIVGTRLEERKLLAEFGSEYRAYQDRVSMLLPFSFVRRRIIGRKA